MQRRAALGTRNAAGTYTLTVVLRLHRRRASRELQRVGPATRAWTKIPLRFCNLLSSRSPPRPRSAINFTSIRPEGPCLRISSDNRRMLGPEFSGSSETERRRQTRQHRIGDVGVQGWSVGATYVALTTGARRLLGQQRRRPSSAMDNYRANEGTVAWASVHNLGVGGRSVVHHNGGSTTVGDGRSRRRQGGLGAPPRNCVAPCYAARRPSGEGGHFSRSVQASSKRAA